MKRTTALVSLALATYAPLVLAQDAPLIDVLTRATQYVARLNEQLSGTVAEERYEQRAVAPSSRAGAGRFPGGRDDIVRRTLRSDYLLVRPTGTNRYYGFRDVFEVDGRPVRDREERLARLFLDSSATAQQQIYGILSESARYNIGDVSRNFNTPTLPLLFLRTANKPRFTFARTADESPSLGLDIPSSATDVWVVAFTETWPTTIIRGRDRKNLPAVGRYWIEAATGRVLASELTLEDEELDVIITVRYDRHETLGHAVPSEMRERYENRRQRSAVDGTASYTRFRRFQVDVQESEPFRD